MDINKLGRILDDARLLRKFNFPMIMPTIKNLMINKLKTADEAIEEIRSTVENHTMDNYWNISKEINLTVKIEDIVDAFLYVIKRDFITKGLTREIIVWDGLKAWNSEIDWNIMVDKETECQGVDITGNDSEIGISVKGYNYKDKAGYPKHKHQLIENSFEKCFIYFVDEKTDEIEHERVK